MITANIFLGANVNIEPGTSVNNVKIGDNVRIAKRCSVFGAPGNFLEIGSNSYIGMNSLLNGFAAKVKIGSFVSIAQNVNIMADSGPNASPELQRIYPVLKGKVVVGDHCWLGANTVVMPGVKLGRFCIVAANSFVNKSFPPYSIIGGSPAKLIRKFTADEIGTVERK